MVDRYLPAKLQPDTMVSNPGGDYVRYSDYATLEAERNALARSSAEANVKLAEAYLAKLRESAEPFCWIGKRDIQRLHSRKAASVNPSRHASTDTPLYLHPTEQTDARSGGREALHLTEYEIQVLLGTSISGCNMSPDRVFSLDMAWHRLYALGLIDRTDGLAIITEKGRDTVGRILSALSPAAPEDREAGDKLAKAVWGVDLVPLSRPTERAWREITEDDQPPLDTDVIMGHWLTVSTRPTEWLVEVGHYGSKRGGWIHGGATHWMPLDVLPAAPALAEQEKTR